MGLDPIDVMKWSALTSGVTFTICAVLLWGFRRGRLRGYTIYVVFSMALLAFRAYAQLETGNVGGWYGAVVWLNLAACGVWGLVGMIGLAGTDPPVYAHRLAPVSKAGLPPPTEEQPEP